jgi:hypothetical protein
MVHSKRNNASIDLDHPHPLRSNNTIIIIISIMQLSILSFLAFTVSRITVMASMVADLGYNEQQAVDDSDWKIQALIHDDNEDLIHEVAR